MTTHNYYKLILISLIIIFTANFISFKVSQRQARDRQRVLDIGNMETAAIKYKAQFGFYPPSKDGRFFACMNNDVDLKTLEKIKSQKIIGLARVKLIARTCDWGVDYLGDIDDASAPRYLDPIPTDPQSFKGLEYKYESDGVSFNIYVHLEGKVDEVILQDLKEKIMCGDKQCNLVRKP